MSFVELVPQPRLFACELQHYTKASLPLHMARLITAELGEPHLRSKSFAAWYAHAIVVETVGGVMTDTVTIPFSLRIDIDGSVTALVPWIHHVAWSKAIASLVPNIVATPISGTIAA